MKKVTLPKNANHGTQAIYIKYKKSLLLIGQKKRLLRYSSL